MLIARRVRLLPNKEQEVWLLKSAGIARFIYNYALDYKITQYQNGVSVGQKDVMREIADLKYTDGYLWLQEIDAETIRCAVRDMLTAYKCFFKRGNKGFPKFKKKGKCKESFYVRCDRLYSADDRHIKFPKLDILMKTSEPMRIEKGTVQNSRISFDGKYWYLSYSYDVECELQELTDEVLGIDLGIKNLAVCSDGTVYRNINHDRSIVILENRLKKLQRKISRAYEKNKQVNMFVKTNNIKKMEHQLKLIHRRLRNIRDTYIHTVTKQIVKTKPSKIVIEGLNISGMMKNRHLAKSIASQCWYKFRQYLIYKCTLAGIRLYAAPRFYPSSKKCSCCGNIKSRLALSERVYACEKCGVIIDRDLNAALNLRNLALT